MLNFIFKLFLLHCLLLIEKKLNEFNNFTFLVDISMEIFDRGFFCSNYELLMLIFNILILYKTIKIFHRSNLKN